MKKTILLLTFICLCFTALGAVPPPIQGNPFTSNRWPTFDLLGSTVSNATFNGTHQGDASGVTGLASNNISGKINPSQIFPALSNGIPLLTVTSIASNQAYLVTNGYPWGLGGSGTNGGGDWIIDRSDMFMDESYTNSTTSNLVVRLCFTLVKYDASPSYCILYVDDDANGTYQQTAVSGLTSSSNQLVFQISGNVPPGGRYWFTNSPQADFFNVLTGTSQRIYSSGGGGGGTVSATFSNSIFLGTNTMTYLNAAHVAGDASTLSNLQWVVYTVGISNAMFQDIQSALNAIQKNPLTNGTPRGTLIQVGPGIYNSNGPALLLTNTFLNSVVIQGSGEISTAIHASNTVFTTTGNVGNPEGARLHFYIRDCALIADQNTTNPIVDMVEYAIFAARNVYFSYNGYITNSQWGISTAPSTPNPNKDPLLVVGAYFHNADENNTWFNHCHFAGLAVGIDAVCQHLFVDQCEFVQIGNYSLGSTNAYAITNPRATGAAILLDNTGYEGHITKCDLVGCRITVAMIGCIAGQFYVRDCYLESGGIALNDDTGTMLEISGAHAPEVTRWVGSSNYANTSGAVSTNTVQWGFWEDNFGSLSSPYWSIYANGAHQAQLMNDYSWRFKGNVAAGGTFTGNGSGLTNLALPFLNQIALGSTGYVFAVNRTNIFFADSGQYFAFTNLPAGTYHIGSSILAQVPASASQSALQTIWWNNTANALVNGSTCSLEPPISNIVGTYYTMRQDFLVTLGSTSTLILQGSASVAGDFCTPIGFYYFKIQ